MPTRDDPPLYTIAPFLPFIDVLAAGLLADGDDPLALTKTILLMPNRRACRAMREAFLRASDGKPCLLPRIIPLGEVEEDLLDLHNFGGSVPIADIPPAMPHQERRFILARLIMQARRSTGLSLDQALSLADDLAGLLDETYRDSITWDGLADIAHERFAAHWQETVQFLSIITDRWPQILAARQQIDAADRHVRLLKAQAAIWRAAPPSDRIICAGSTGTLPAVAALMAVILDLPRGAVILPGIDLLSDDQTWSQIAVDPNHPQFALAGLLRRLRLARGQVKPWPSGNKYPAIAPGSAREALMAATMLPAARLNHWHDIASDESLCRSIAGAANGLTRIDCRDETEEAITIATIMRETLEHPAKTAALITPDRHLARRVAQELRRWNIDVDDSAGQALAQTPPAILMRLVVGAVEAQFAPAAFLSLMKHPLVTFGRNGAEVRDQIRVLEKTVLRGPRPRPGLDGIVQALRAENTAPPDWWPQLTDAFAPLIKPAPDDRVSLNTVLRAHIAACEILSGGATPADGPAALWQGDAGEALHIHLQDVMLAAETAVEFPLGRYGPLFDTLLAGKILSPAFRRHPRLSILGTLEARLQHWDRVILGGLNETVWPAVSQPDPWLNRPLRDNLGLPSPDRFTGLAAHDFVQATCRPEIYLTRAQRGDGQPTIPSRWLLRLDGFCELLQIRPGGNAELWLSHARALQRLPDHAPPEPAPSPAPRPPASARPKLFHASALDLLSTDPYGFYARHILNLRPLDPLDAKADAAERGQLIHDILAAFVTHYPVALPPDADKILLTIGEDFFARYAHRPAIRALWWPRFQAIAAWFIEHERTRQDQVQERFAEISGRANWPEGFTLAARADRIDRLKDGHAIIIDYKTGTLPAKSAVKTGVKPQLLVEALILERNGFSGISQAPVAGIEYWRLSGQRRQPGLVQAHTDSTDETQDLLRILEAKIVDRIRLYADENQPFIPGAGNAYDDYAHLARRAEWDSEGEE